MLRIRAFSKTTLVGFGVLLPVLIALFIVGWILGFFGIFLQVPANFFSAYLHFPGFLSYVASAALFVALCFGIGIFMKTAYGRRCVWYLTEEWLKRLPGYDFLHTLVGQLFRNQATDSADASASFKVVRLPLVCERKIGLITDEWNGWCAVWVPSAPVPSNGTNSMWRLEELEVLNTISAAEALQSVFKCGVGYAERFGRALEAMSAASL